MATEDYKNKPLRFPSFGDVDCSPPDIVCLIFKVDLVTYTWNGSDFDTESITRCVGGFIPTGLNVGTSKACVLLEDIFGVNKVDFTFSLLEIHYLSGTAFNFSPNTNTNGRYTLSLDSFKATHVNPFLVPVNENRFTYDAVNMQLVWSVGTGGGNIPLIDTGSFQAGNITEALGGSRADTTQQVVSVQLDWSNPVEQAFVYPK